MHRISLLLASLGLFLAGCSETTRPAGETPGDTVTARKPAAEDLPMEEADSAQPGEAAEESTSPEGEDAAARLKRELTEARDAAIEWAAESKEKLVEKAEQRLAEVDEQIDKLEGQAQDLTDEAKTRWEEQKAQLEQKREELARQIEELRASSGDAWKSMMEGIGKAYADLKEATEQAADELKK